MNNSKSIDVAFHTLKLYFKWTCNDIDACIKDLSLCRNIQNAGKISNPTVQFFVSISRGLFPSTQPQVLTTPNGRRLEIIVGK